jgi:hypothetical protein
MQEIVLAVVSAAERQPWHGPDLLVAAEQEAMAPERY